MGTTDPADNAANATTIPPAHRFGGVVSDFDEARGLGTIDRAGTSIPFQCVAIADGTRTIAIGAAVEFGIASRFGTYEASEIRPR